VFLSEMLEKMNISAPVVAAQTENGLRLSIQAETMGLLIGRRGETLDAMQYLVSLVANKNRKDESYTRITLDTEGYRSRREETLKRLARKNATQVRQTGRPVTMEPMNPYERRILHSALQGFSGVTTHSEGEEPNRYVVITPNR
jgi:spoIIIJ-associated protein